MSDAASKALPEPKRRFFPLAFVGVLLAWGILFVLFVMVCPMPFGARTIVANPIMQYSHALGLSMYSYANDHDGKYPDGESSTEVFQKLLDGGYISDPAICYLPRAGKTKALPGQKLRPENVCWDVTSGVDSNSSDEIPLVFMTGYKVNYVPSGTAIPLVKPYVPYPKRTWQGWWQNEPDPWPGSSGIAVYYKNNSAIFIVLQIPADAAPSIPNFISPDFKPDGKTYRQLTPEGVLPGN